MYNMLSVKSNYSLLSSLLTIDDIIDYNIKNNRTNAVICDDNMYGTMEFIKKCNLKKIKPVVGLEVSFDNYKILLYIKNYQGYLNLIKICTRVNDNTLTIEDIINYKDNLFLLVPFDSLNFYLEHKDKFTDIYLGFSNKKEESEALVITKDIVYLKPCLYKRKEDSDYLKYLYLIRDGKTLNDNISYDTFLDYVKAYEHFITVGIYEGRQGSMYFNPKWYVENNTDIKGTYGENYSKALEQFVNYGLKEGRRASAEFNVKQYRENYADLREAYGTNYKEYYKHYISYGKAEGRNGTTKVVRKLSELEEYLYNEEVYLSANGDIRELYKKDSTKTKNHWIEYGIRDGRKASLVFDAKWYLENNKDLKEAYGNDYTKAYNHFIEYGIKEGRQGSIYFNAKWYLENNADLKEVYGKDYTKALKHFVEYGAKEVRAGSKEFNCKKYKANYADLREAYGNDNIQYFLHYMNCGIKEGRKPI